MRIDVRGKPRPFRVLVATDGSPHARAAVAATRLFPWPDGARADGWWRGLFRGCWGDGGPSGQPSPDHCAARPSAPAARCTDAGHRRR